MDIIEWDQAEADSVRAEQQDERDSEQESDACPICDAELNGSWCVNGRNPHHN